MNQVIVSGVVTKVEAREYGQEGKSLYNITLDVEGYKGKTETLQVTSFDKGAEAFTSGAVITVVGRLSGQVNPKGFINMKVIATSIAGVSKGAAIAKSDDSIPF